MGQNGVQMGEQFQSNTGTADADSDSRVDPISAISNLAEKIRIENAEYRRELEQILQTVEGVEVADSGALKDFRAVFSEVTKRLGVGPLLPSGRRGSLQIQSEKKGKAWMIIHSSGEDKSCGAPANTIPSLKIG